MSDTPRDLDVPHVPSEFEPTDPPRRSGDYGDPELNHWFKRKGGFYIHIKRAVLGGSPGYLVSIREPDDPYGGQKSYSQRSFRTHNEVEKYLSDM